MKNLTITLSIVSLFMLGACTGENADSSQQDSSTVTTELTGQSGVKDDQSNPNIVQVAVSSPDHTTLVTAVKAAELVDALSNAGPFTVFAPTNDAFNALPKGTVEDLLTPEKKNDLVDILQYHVTVGVYKTESMQDGQSLGQVNGGNVKISKKDGAYYVNGNAKIIASIVASNGIIHVVDHVLLPQ